MSERLEVLDEALLTAQREGWDLETEIRSEVEDAERLIRDSYKGRERAIWRKVSKAQGQFDAEKARLAQVEAGYEPGQKLIHPAQPGKWGHGRRLCGVIEIVTKDSYLDRKSYGRPELGSMIIRHVKVDGTLGKMYEMPDYRHGLFEGWRPAKDGEHPKPRRKRGPYKKKAALVQTPVHGVTVQ